MPTYETEVAISQFDHQYYDQYFIPERYQHQPEYQYQPYQTEYQYYPYLHQNISEKHYDRVKIFYFLSMTHWIIIRTHFIAVIFSIHFNFVNRIIIIYRFNVENELYFSSTISSINPDL